jgi:hypothetical protein
MAKRIKSLLMAGLLLFSQTTFNLVTFTSQANAEETYPQIIKISEGLGGAESNGWSFAPTLSAGGSHAVFPSDATNLILNDTNSERDLFVRSLATGTTERITVTDDEQQIQPNSWR